MSAATCTVRPSLIGSAAALEPMTALSRPANSNRAVFIVLSSLSPAMRPDPLLKVMGLPMACGLALLMSALRTGVPAGDRAAAGSRDRGRRDLDVLAPGRRLRCALRLLGMPELLQ